MTRLPLVLAVGGDPGGANALAPVLRALRDSGRVRVETRAYRHARNVWRRHELPFEDLNELAEPSLPSETKLLLAGTSLNGVNLEKQFIAAAATAKIPSLALVDFWSNYRRRFSSDDKDTLDYLPNKIAVMDAHAKEEMIGEGIDAERIIITGQPAFDHLQTWRSTFGPADRRKARQQFGVGDNELLVLFASQPYSSFSGADPSLPPYRGYDERRVAAMLLQALEKTAAESARPITLVIRPHPREDASNFGHLRSDGIPIRVVSDGDAYAAAVAADLVVGMNTVLLVEACYLGCVVASLQPNLLGLDPLPTNRLGFSRAVYSTEEIFPAIRELLLDQEIRHRMLEKLRRFCPDGAATRRVAELVFDLLQCDSPTPCL